MKLTIAEVLEATKGKLMYGSGGEMMTGVSTDSRSAQKGDLFVALHGPKHDGHEFLREVFRKGTVGAVVDKPVRSRLVGDRCIIKVKNTLAALGDLAQWWRRRFPVRVVAITGSNGKTTTKDMIAALLSSKYRILKTEGNFNNLIGLPLTVFRLDESVEVAVLEMGMNRRGEIDRLAKIADPEVGVITNVARAHLEGLGGLREVTQAKAELLPHLSKDELAILNADDPATKILKKSCRCRLVTFGVSPDASVRLMSQQVDGMKGISFAVKIRGRTVSFRIPILGRQNIGNAMAAIAVADHFGIPPEEMKRVLADFRTGSKRMEVFQLSKGVHLINDSYNANPDSMTASLEFLKEAVKNRRRVAILGDMLELGTYAARFHREIGAKAAEKGVKFLVAVGPHAGDVVRGARQAGMAQKATMAFRTLEDALADIPSKIQRGDVILIKGSRGMGMDRMTEGLKDVL